MRETIARVWARVRALEPARLAEAVRMALAATVTLGWLTIDDARVNTIVSAVAVVASLFATNRVRASVTPVAKLGGCDAVIAHDPATEG
jgi:hypothetical protein